MSSFTFLEKHYEKHYFCTTDECKIKEIAKFSDRPKFDSFKSGRATRCFKNPTKN